MDISAFLSADKSMVIAPAGYGKTHTIADCISHYTGNKKILGNKRMKNIGIRLIFLGFVMLLLLIILQIFN